jgi:hypothetical protein
MYIWDNDDYETPIEDYPGYLGLSCDGTFLCGTELKPLESDFSEYSELVDESGGERRLSIALPSGDVAISFSAYDDIAETLDQLPTVRVNLHNDPAGAGPASSVVYSFFIEDGVSQTELEPGVAALVAALKSDLTALETGA